MDQAVRQQREIDQALKRLNDPRADGIYLTGTGQWVTEDPEIREWLMAAMRTALHCRIQTMQIKDSIT